MKIRVYLLQLFIFLIAPLFSQDRLAYRAPGIERIQPIAGTYGSGLNYKLYLPQKDNGRKFPLVVFINGVGSDVTTWNQYIDWPKAMAANGLAAVAYEVNGETPYEHTKELLQLFLKGETFPQVDGERIVLWMCSSNGRVGTQILFDPEFPQIKGASLYYPALEVDQPMARSDVTLELVRAGMDSYSINRLIDQWIPKALAKDLDLRIINFPAARHAFDMFDEALPQTAPIIENTISFLREVAFGESPVSDPETTPVRLLELLRSNELDRADEIYERALEQDSITQTNLYFNGLYRSNGLQALSATLEEEGNLEAALLPILWSLKIDPEHPNHHDNLASLYLKMGNKTKALEHSRLALQYLEGLSHPNQQFIQAIRQAASERIEEVNGQK